MPTPKRRPAAAFLLFIVCCCAGLRVAEAQEQPPQDTQARPAAAQRDDTNHDVHLYMIVGTNDAAAKGALPQFMEGVARQLKSSLPFAGYRLASTLVYRVKDGGGLEVRGVSGASLTGLPPGTPKNSVYYEFKIQRLKAEKNPAGQSFVEVRSFRFGMRVPIITATVRGEAGSGESFPVVNHEETGVSTELNVRDGEPALVSTVTTSRADEAIILVLLVRQAGK